MFFSLSPLKPSLIEVEKGLGEWGGFLLKSIFETLESESIHIGVEGVGRRGWEGGASWFLKHRNSWNSPKDT